MLSISNLIVAINDQNIINNLSLNFSAGSIHALMGPNGSGKSTLAYTLLGHQRYMIKQGSIIFNGVDLLNLAPHKRAQLGIFLAFQQPYELSGVSILTFLKEMNAARTGITMEISEFHKICADVFAMVGLDPSFLQRSVNEGFSGGEKKRFELAQMLLFNPNLIILDEIDSGLDIDALKMVANVIARLREQNPHLIVLIITHYPRLLQHIQPDFVHVMRAGTIAHSGNQKIVQQLEATGYQEFI